MQTLDVARAMLTEIGVGGGMGRSDGRKGEVGVRIRRGGSKGGRRKRKNKRNRGVEEVSAGRGTGRREGV